MANISQQDVKATSIFLSPMSSLLLTVLRAQNF